MALWIYYLNDLIIFSKDTELCIVYLHNLYVFWFFLFKFVCSSIEYVVEWTAVHQ